MPRNRTKIRRTKSEPVKKTTNVPQNNTTTSVGSTVASGVANGMSLGAGAAIGSTMAHGAMDLFTSSKPIENNTQNNNFCNDLMDKFKNCALNNLELNYNELNNCKPYLELYNQCLKDNNM